MSTWLGYHQVYSGVVRSAEGLMSPSVVLLAWTSPGAQAHHMNAAAQLDFVAVKELCFMKELRMTAAYICIQSLELVIFCLPQLLNS